MDLTPEEIEKIKEEEKKDMLEDLADMREETPVPGTDPPEVTTDAPEEFETEVPATEAPDDEFETEAPETQAPETDAPTTDAPDDDLETKAKAAELDLLREKEKRDEEASAKTKAPATSAPPTQAPHTMPPLDDVDLLDGLDMEDVTSDPKVLNKLLNKVLQEGVKIGRTSTTESVLRSIPTVMGSVVSQQLALRESVNDFYKNNEDLGKYKKIVALTAEKLGSQNPEWSLEQLYEESGKETRKVLGLKAKATGGKKGEKKPAFGRGTKGKGTKKGKQKPNLTSLQKEIQDMIDIN